MAASQTQAWRVLIADEEAEVRSQLGGLLRGWDCEIWEAADGATAQEFLQQGVVDAAFVNAQLPGVSGWELFQAARDLPRQVPVILFTTTGTQGMEAEIMRTNTMQELTTHPVDRDELIHAIQRALHGLARPDVDARREQEARLYQSHKLEAIGRLATGVAHDFNNLLTIIMGYSEIALAGLGETDPLRCNLEQIHRAGDRAAALARQLLAFGRKHAFAPMLLDISAVVTELDKMLQRLIAEEIELVTRLEPAPGPVRADPGQLEQVIVNLVLNARDAMPQGGRLQIETANVMLDEAAAEYIQATRPGPHVMLSVTDTGHGMTPEIQARVFEPFFTTKEEGKGTGLGLAIVRDIVQESQGTIHVCSEPGHGTTFTIYFPAAEDGGKPANITRAVRAKSPPGWETVLVVEDDDGVRLLVRDILEKAGYTVIEARQGEEAIRLCGQYDGPIDLLVTDVVMRQLGGKKLADHLQGLRPTLRVLFISGYAAVTATHQGVLNSGTTFLQKPFTPEALIAKVKEILQAPTAPQGGLTPLP